MEADNPFEMLEVLFCPENDTTKVYRICKQPKRRSIIFCDVTPWILPMFFQNVDKLLLEHMESHPSHSRENPKSNNNNTKYKKLKSYPCTGRGGP
jgi:hypothetical protein